MKSEISLLWFLWIAALIALLASSLLFIGCGSNAMPTTPTQPPATTGTLHLTNTSAAILNVYWDGRYLTQLSPGVVADYGSQPLGPHSISWEAIEQDWWQLVSPGGATAVFCLGPNNTIRSCNGRTVCQGTIQISAGLSSTAAPCAFDARPSCTSNNTSVLLLANTSAHDDDILVDRTDRGIMHPTTDPTNVQSGDLAAFVVPPGQHHLDFLHYPPPRWNACIDVTLTVSSCQVLAYSCQY